MLYSYVMHNLHMYGTFRIYLVHKDAGTLSATAVITSNLSTAISKLCTATDPNTIPKTIQRKELHRCYHTQPGIVHQQLQTPVTNCSLDLLLGCLYAVLPAQGKILP